MRPALPRRIILSSTPVAGARPCVLRFQQTPCACRSSNASRNAFVGIYGLHLSAPTDIQAPVVAASLSQASCRTAAPGAWRGSTDSRPIFSPSLRLSPAMTMSIPVMLCHLFPIATRSWRVRTRQTVRRLDMTSHQKLRIVTRTVPGARIIARISKVHILLQTLRRISAGLACDVQSQSAFPSKPPSRAART